MIWELVHPPCHMWVKKMPIVEFAHFLDGLLGRPTLEGNAVRSDKHAAAIAAQPAMNEDFPAGLLPDQREESSDFFICGQSPARARQIDKSNVQRLCSLPFSLCRPWRLTAQIDDGIDAEPLELFHSVIFGLPATIEEIVDLAEI